MLMPLVEPQPHRHPTWPHSDQHCPLQRQCRHLRWLAKSIPTALEEHSHHKATTAQSPHIATAAASTLPMPLYSRRRHHRHTNTAAIWTKIILIMPPTLPFQHYHCRCRSYNNWRQFPSHHHHCCFNTAIAAIIQLTSKNHFHCYTTAAITTLPSKLSCNSPQTPIQTSCSDRVYITHSYNE